MSSPGLRYVTPAARIMRNFFGRFGVSGAGFRGIANWIVPVSVVDRYRDDSEGSLFAITATAQVPAGNVPAFAFGSSQNDWELLAAAWGFFTTGGNDNQWMNLFIYTPDATYVPVQTPSPVGFFVSGLNSDFAFTLGSVSGVAGYNPGTPSRFGFFPFASRTKLSTFTETSTYFDSEGEYIQFAVPIRVYRDVTLGFHMVEAMSRARDITVSILYRERPRTTAGPQTG